jgi:hypothetical protein
MYYVIIIHFSLNVNLVGWFIVHLFTETDVLIILPIFFISQKLLFSYRLQIP